MLKRKVAGFLFFRNFILAALVGLLTGAITQAVSPRKKGKSQDLFWGIGGAVLATLLLAFLRGGAKLIPLLFVQLIGSLILILLGRLVK